MLSKLFETLCRADSDCEWVHWTSLLYKDVVEPPFQFNQFLLSCFFEVDVVLQNSLPCWFRLKMSPLHIFALQGCGWVTHLFQLVYVILFFWSWCHPWKLFAILIQVWKSQLASVRDSYLRWLTKIRLYHKIHAKYIFLFFLYYSLLVTNTIENMSTKYLLWNHSLELFVTN